jgi:hypothetical protein
MLAPVKRGNFSTEEMAKMSDSQTINKTGDLNSIEAADENEEKTLPPTSFDDLPVTDEQAEQTKGGVRIGKLLGVN